VAWKNSILVGIYCHSWCITKIFDCIASKCTGRCVGWSTTRKIRLAIREGYGIHQNMKNPWEVLTMPDRLVEPSSLPAKA